MKRISGVVGPMAVAIAMAVSMGAAAQGGADNPACAELASIAIPKSDEPDAAARTRLDACDSESFYYADGGKPDYAEARRCAYLERESGNQLVFGGSSVLMMIYANGYGVPRNLELAKKFACETDGAPAELDGRLAHLDELAKAGAKAEPLDLCDDITSGYMMGFCANRSAEAAKVDRDKRVVALTAKWSPDLKSAFAKVRAAADAYFEAAVDGEVDMSGTARGAMAIGARETLENALVEALTDFEQGKLPRGDAAAFAAADKALNATYAATIKKYKADAAEGISGTITPDGIREAERAWIKYRDAWIAFGAQKYPAVSADAWRTFFTLEREKALKELLGE
jgi:uncharacterized protein YecT (DUF1311 family)